VEDVKKFIIRKRKKLKEKIKISEEYL